MQLPPQLRPAAADRQTSLAIRAWNVMGGLDWAALPVVSEMFGISDIDIFVHQLTAIRDWQKDSE